MTNETMENPQVYKTVDLKRGVDHIGVGCIFFCHDGRGNVLFHRRSQSCRDEQGRWDSGGGCMEFGETFEETVRREIKEEYGVEPITIERAGVKNVLREHDGRQTHWVMTLFIALVDPSSVTIGEPEKMDEIGWFALDALPKPLHSQIPTDLEIVDPFLRRVAVD